MENRSQIKFISLIMTIYYDNLNLYDNDYDNNKESYITEKVNILAVLF